MRNYMRFWYCRFREQSVQFNTNIVVEKIKRTQAELQTAIDGLKADIVAADADWVGTLLSAGECFIELNKANFNYFVNVVVTTQSAPVTNLFNQKILVFESPRKTWSHGH